MTDARAVPEVSKSMSTKETPTGGGEIWDFVVLNSDVTEVSCVCCRLPLKSSNPSGSALEWGSCNRHGGQGCKRRVGCTRRVGCKEKSLEARRIYLPNRLGAEVNWFCVFTQTCVHEADLQPKSQGTGTSSDGGGCDSCQDFGA